MPRAWRWTSFKFKNIVIMYISFALVVAVAAVVEAYAVPAGHAFQDPKTINDAVRSPCPVCS